MAVRNVSVNWIETLDTKDNPIKIQCEQDPGGGIVVKFEYGATTFKVDITDLRDAITQARATV